MYVIGQNERHVVKCWTDGVELEDAARQQLLNVAALPFIHRHVAVMPDVHWGIGATVGSVIPTVGAIVPAAVGVDVGCGLVAQRTNLTASDLPDNLAALRQTIEIAIPHGRTDNGGYNDVGAWPTPAWPADVYAAWNDLEVVPRLHEGMVTDIAMFRALLDTVSCLGGQKIEGAVIKNYLRYGLDKKVLMGKFVSEAFKEVHAAEWKKANPASGDVIESLIRQYKTPARWAKAVQHLQEAGQLEDSPRDIGLLMKEVPPDVEKECAQEIKAALYTWAWPKIRRGIIAGLPEWYKERLLERQFDKPVDG